MNQGKVRRRFDVRASAAGIICMVFHLTTDDLRFAGELGKEVVKTTFHRVVVENVVPQFITRDDALELLEEHVTNNLLKVYRGCINAKMRWVNNSIDKRSGFRRARSCRLSCVISFTRIWKGGDCPFSKIRTDFFCG